MQQNCDVALNGQRSMHFIYQACKLAHVKTFCAPNKLRAQTGLHFAIQRNIK